MESKYEKSQDPNLLVQETEQLMARMRQFEESIEERYGTSRQHLGAAMARYVCRDGGSGTDRYMMPSWLEQSAEDSWLFDVERCGSEYSFEPMQGLEELAEESDSPEDPELFGSQCARLRDAYRAFEAEWGSAVATRLMSIVQTSS